MKYPVQTFTTLSNAQTNCNRCGSPKFHQKCCVVLQYLPAAFFHICRFRHFLPILAPVSPPQCVMAQAGTLGLTEYVVAGSVSARVMEVEALTRDVARAIVVTEPVADRLSPQVCVRMSL